MAWDLMTCDKKWKFVLPDSLSEETKRLLADPTEVAEWASVIRMGEIVDCGIPTRSTLRWKIGIYAIDKRDTDRPRGGFSIHTLVLSFAAQFRSVVDILVGLSWKYNQFQIFS